MFSSGTSAKTTNSAANVTLIDLSAIAGAAYNRLVITNEGTTAGFFSVDGGQSWGRIPAGASGAPAVVTWLGRSSSSPLIKRDSSDMSAVFAFADWIDYR